LVVFEMQEVVSSCISTSNTDCSWWFLSGWSSSVSTALAQTILGNHWQGKGKSELIFE
jgi:hypothetical protein